MKTVLLTGVTGLVGRHVLYELLRQAFARDMDRQIFVTIRGNGVSAEDRLREVLEEGACPADLASHGVDRLLQRVRVLDVDLLDERLGGTIAAAVPEGCYVIHSAASTNLAPSETAEHEVASHVIGATRNLLNAVSGRAKKFVYIGSSFASGPVAGTVSDDYFALETGAARNHYERAKLETEQMMRDFCEADGLEWQILRPSVVCGRMFDAPLHYMSKFDVFYGFGKFFRRLVKAGCSERIRVFCRAESSINVVPVDYVARVIVRAATTRVQQLNVVHENSIPAPVLISSVLRAVGFGNFELVEEMPRNLNEAEQLYYSTAGAIFSSYITSPAQRYDARRLSVMMDGVAPPDMTAALPALLEYALACDFDSSRCARKAKQRAARSAPRPKRVVLLGSGYVSLFAYRALRRRMRTALANGELEIVVVSSSNYHMFHGFVGEVLAGVLPLDTILSPSRQLFAGARFVQGAVTRVDLENRQIHYLGAAGDTATLGYDELVLGTGSENDSGKVPGLERYGQSVRSFQSLQGLQQHVVQMLERAEGERDQAEVQRLLTFCVAGAGFTGVEMCTALAQFLHSCRAHYSVLQQVAPRPRVVLVHGGDEVLPELNKRFQRLVRYARRQIDGWGIELKLGTRLIEVQPDVAFLDDGTRLETRSVFCTVGHRPVTMPGTERCPADTQRRLLTDRCLNLIGHRNVWVGGDSACVKQPFTRHACPANALWAIKHGQHIGRNLARRLRGGRLRPFSYPGLGQAASFGDHKGIAELYGVQLTGPLAKVIRLGFFLFYMPSNRNAVQVVFELLLRALFGSKRLTPKNVGLQRDYRVPAAADDPALEYYN